MSIYPLSRSWTLLTVIAFSFFVSKASHAEWRTNVHVAKPLSVLFVGNSHLLMPRFIEKVRNRIREQTGREPKYRILAKIGTTLTKTKRKKATKRTLMAANWDVIVLQESTVAFLTPHGRRSFASTVKWFNRHKPARSKIVLWETWPQGQRHALYHRRGVWGRWFKKPPRTPKQLYSWIAAGTKRAAEANAAYVAPIGLCWMRRPPKRRPYAKDRYHASPKGLTFVAGILAKAVIAAARANTQPDRSASDVPGPDTRCAG